MKNAMKRIMCMMIAVMLLISAVPAAFAADGEFGSITVKVKDSNDKPITSFEYEMTRETTTGANLVKYILNDMGLGTYGTPSKVVLTAGPNADNKKDIGADGAITDGNTVWIVTDLVNPPAADEDDDKKDDTTTETVEPIKVIVKVNESDNVIGDPIYKEPANGEYATVENLLHYCWSKDWTNVYSYDHGWVTGRGNVDKSDKVYAGETLYIMLNNDEVPEADKDDDKDDSNTNNGTADDDVYTFNYASPNKGKTYTMRLHIFLNRNTSTAHKTVTLNLGKEDDEFNLADAKAIVEARYDAVDKDKGIEYDGLYIAEGDWLGKYAEDNRYTYIRGLKNARSNQYVNLYIVIDNAKVESSGTADPSNPKTGDSIMIAVSTMALAGAALVSVMELKKRKMI